MATPSDHPNKQMNPGQRYDSGLGSLNQQPNIDEQQVPQEVAAYDHDPELEIFHLESEDEQDVDPAYVSLEPGDLSSLQLTSMPLITTLNESPSVIDPDIDVCPPDTSGSGNDLGQADMNNNTSSSSTTTTISTSQITEQGVHSSALPDSPNEVERIHDHSATKSYEGELAMNVPFPSTLLSNVTSQPIEIIIREQIAEGSDFDQERVLVESKVPSP